MTGENNLGRDLASIDAFYKKNPELNVKAPMTETHSLGDWEDKFIDQIETCLDADAHGPLLPGIMFKDIEHIARRMVPIAHELLLAQKEGFRREIKEAMKDITAHLEPGMNPRTQEEVATKITNYNYALNDLLTKLDTNGI